MRCKSKKDCAFVFRWFLCYLQQKCTGNFNFMGILVFKMMEDSINTGIGYLALNKKIKEQGVDSYVGRIAIDSVDTLEFDLGWYSND